MRHWLMKSEPSVFSIEDLRRRPTRTGPWDGVRNYQARNHLREMKRGDLVLFYHSSEDPIGVAGTAEVVGEARPDPTQFDRRSPYFDPKSKTDAPRWSLVDVKWRSTFRRLVPLSMLRADPRLRGMILLQPGSRLSVMPVTPAEFRVVLELAAAA